MRALILSLMCFFGFSISTQANTVPWYSHSAEGQVTITVNLFISSTCPHCHKADLFFHEIEKKEPWLKVHRYVINQNKVALETFYTYLQQQKESDFSVPAIFFCDSRWIGFSDNKTTGKILLQALKYCHNQIIQQGELNQTTIKVLRKQALSTHVKINLSLAESPVLFTLWSAFTDAFSPCSLFCMAAFFSFLWLYPTQRMVQLGLGVLFLISLSLVHSVQQVFSLNYYQEIPEWIPWVRPIGAALLFAVFIAYRKKVLQMTSYPSLLMLVVLVLTVFAVQTYQQTCALNMAFIYDQWITKQAYVSYRRFFCFFIYQALYLLPLILVLVFYFFKGRHRLLRASHNIFNRAAYLILGSIGIILLLFPTLLVSLWVSVMVLSGSILLGWFLERRYAKVD